MRKYVISVVLFCIFRAAALAQPGKVLRVAFPEAETGFDPAMAHDSYSPQVIQSIFEPLFTYDYLARPVKLAPQTALTLPEIGDHGLTYTIRLKKDIFFTQDEAFHGRQRELTMADYVYSFKRLMDPRTKSPHAWLLAGKIVGLDAWARSAHCAIRCDYDAPVAGMELLDRYTLRLRLTTADYNFGQLLAHYPSSAVAREIVESYGGSTGRIDAHPVGTGPYRLDLWQRSARIVLEANPAYRKSVWAFEPGADLASQQIAKQMRGKQIPQIQRIDIRIVEEEHTRWLLFEQDHIDLLPLQGPLSTLALQGSELRTGLAQRGVQLSRAIEPEFNFHYWNMRHPVTGGLGKDKIALRRALAMAYDIQEEIHHVWGDQAALQVFPIPPGVAGHNPSYVGMNQYDPALANSLLDRFGYAKDKDGWRTLPDHSPLVIQYYSPPDARGRLQAEMWHRAGKKVGIRIVSVTQPMAELLKAAKQCQLQLRTASWSADYPDGDNFMQLFYGKNIGLSNNMCVEIPAYDAMYQASAKLPAGAQRDALYLQMARLLESHAVVIAGYARYANVLARPRVRGYKKHPILPTEWMYFDIDQGR